MVPATTTTPLNGVRLDAVGELAGACLEDSEKAQATWSASVTWNGGFRSEATIREFDAIPSDEPEGLGGDDSAPNPVEQLLASLGNCLAVGYAANASAAGIEIRDLKIELEGDLNLQTFLSLDQDGNASYEGIQVKVQLDANASDSAIEALHAKTVGTSPVGHTLSRPVPVSIDLA
jgi:uncharacterized OsmC-like protein